MRRRPHRAAGGFTLIELLIGVAIVGILLSLGVPAFSDYMRNTRVRTHADAINSALKLARSEAVRRNVYVRFQLVNTMDGTCDVTDATAASANFWVLSVGDPTDRCNKDLVDPTPSQAAAAQLAGGTLSAALTDPPFLLAKGIRETSRDEFETRLTLYNQTNLAALPGPVVVPDRPPVVCFAPTGQLARYDSTTGACTTSRNPATTRMIGVGVEVGPAPGLGLPACAPAGTSRCLRVEVRPGGESRLCDRAVAVLNPAAPAGADPRGCSW